MTSIRPEFLIVGQGLAGSCLALALQRRGRRVVVADAGREHAASTVAAGLVNPLAGIRFNAAPGTGLWLEAAEGLYDALGREFGQSFYHRLPMLRLFRSEQQVRFFTRRQALPADPYVTGPLPPERVPAELHAPLGGFVQGRTGYLDLPALLAALEDRFRAAGCFLSARIDWARLEIFDDHVHAAGVDTAHLVVCTGARLAETRWFADLPLAPEKGEVLDIASPRRLTDAIVNKGHWLVPLASGGYRFGATHEHDFADTAPSPAGRRALTAALEALLTRTEDLEIGAQSAGIRPSTRDRQPLIGTHPACPRLHLFNGFGGRGCLKVPWYAERFADYLTGQGAVPAEADIARYGDGR